jgi:phosphatidylglycerol---prolipoprotein diacylglyceryl transferase
LFTLTTMFVHNLNPIIFELGPLAIRWYGLAYVIGFLLAYWYTKRAAKQGTIKGLTLENADSFLIYLILGVILGGRVLQFVFFRPTELFTNPVELFLIWHGGMSFHGGLIGAIIAGALFCSKHNIKLIALADLIIIPAAIALSLGRIANFINAEMVGTLTTVPWCVEFPTASGCRHPVVLYESLKTLLIALGLILTKKRLDKKQLVIPGLLFWLFITSYGALRFIINYLRDEPHTILGIMSTGQLLSLSMAVLGAFMLAKLLNTTKTTPQKDDKNDSAHHHNKKRVGKRWKKNNRR